jgi:hypothetical protein
MLACPNCGNGYHDDENFCLDCGLKVAGEDAHPCGSPDRQMRYRAVYKAPDEWMAITIRDLLQSAGYAGQILSVSEPWADGVTRLAEGYWGKVIVLEGEVAGACKLIEDYLKGLEGPVH